MLRLQSPDLIRPLIGNVKKRRGRRLIAVYHVTNQRPDKDWYFQTQRSQVSCKNYFPEFTQFISHYISTG